MYLRVQKMIKGTTTTVGANQTHTPKGDEEKFTTVKAVTVAM